MLKSRSTDLDILIVGAGPVGLFLANECVRRGLRSRIIEANSGQSLHSKALAIFPRTLEIFDMAGLAPDFLRLANRVRSVAAMSHDHALARIRFEPDDTPYPFISMVPQNVTEELLAQALERKGTEVEYNTRFFSMNESLDVVSVVIEKDGKQEQIRARYVVGCDGAHSAVRRSLGITLDGGEYDMPFMLADIETNQDLPADELQLCSSAHGPIAIFPMSATRRRVVATVERTEGDAPTLEFTQRLLQQRAPKTLQAIKLYWSSYFRIHHRHAFQLRSGRVFLAGDAAHIHSPFGGQGMNTGLQDVWNLVWKLELAARGSGSEALLESYSEERVPMIEEVIEATDRLTKALGTPSTLAQLLRDSAIPILSRIPAFGHAIVERLSGLGLTYSGSIIHNSGKRLLEDCMRDGQIADARFLLFVPKTTCQSFIETSRSIEASLNGLLAVYASRDERIRLVRPDGYIAFESESEGSGDESQLIRALLDKMLLIDCKPGCLVAADALTSQR
jgi:2-polyprenyl-6-methoxyphenol hydroxylase-like FAD-dependent oxidoreductase